jgi:hypothetical protein
VEAGLAGGVPVAEVTARGTAMACARVRRPLYEVYILTRVVIGGKTFRRWRLHGRFGQYIDARYECLSVLAGCQTEIYMVRGRSR